MFRYRIFAVALIWLCSGCQLAIRSVRPPASTDGLASLPYHWTFDASETSSYLFASPNVEFAGGVCRLSASQQSDLGNTSPYGFASGSGNGVTYSSSFLYLSHAGSPTNVSQLDSSWGPQWAQILALWHLNETSWSGAVSEVNDGTGHGYLGQTFNGATTTTSGKMFGAGAFSGFVGVGTHSFVSIPYIPAFDNISKFTWSAWARPTSLGDYATVLSRNGGVNDYVAMQLNGGGDNKNVAIILRNGAATSAVTASQPISVGIWHHWSVVFDGTQVGDANRLKFYIDGVQIPLTYNGPIPASITNPSAFPIYIGSENTASGPWNGVIDEVAIWTTALTAAEVATIYQRQYALYSGTQTSRVMDAWSTGQSWTNLSWVATLPFLKALPDYSGSIQNEITADYSSLVGSNGNPGDNDLMTGIVGLWHLNGPVGSISTGATVTDSSGGNRHGTASNANTTGMSYVTAPLGQGIIFDGVDDVIEAPGPDLTASHTMSAWIYPRSNPTGFYSVFNSLAGTGGPENNQYNIYVSAGGAILTNPPCNSVGAIEIGAWSHVAVTYATGAPGTAKIYINGLIDNTCSVTKLGVTTTFLGLGAKNSTNNLFIGALDEMALWSRVLSPQEVLQVYRRGANRLKFQVRTCTASDCSDDATGTNWKGPDGTNQSYLSELYNTSVQATVPSGGVLKTLPNMQFSNFTGLNGTSRYFQYRAIFESNGVSSGCNYGAGLTWCSPELKTIQVDPVHYDKTPASVVGRVGVRFTSLTGLTEVLGTCAGGVSYNLSMDGTVWYWWSGAAWAIANGTTAQSNPATAITAQLPGFSTQVGTGAVYFKAYLNSSGIAPCELDDLYLTGI